MTIAEARQKLKERLAALSKLSHDILLVGILILSCSLSFGFGYLAGRDAQRGLPTLSGQGSEATRGAQEPVIASKNGTKYYFSSCAGAERISAANKVTFISAQAAEEQGYARAANCQAP